MVCGFGEAASYETLVRKITKSEIDKSARFTDWSRRPLSKRQLEYALADVTHLREVYDTLAKDLQKSGRVALGRGRGSDAQGPGDLPARSRRCLAPPEAALDEQALPDRADRACRLARARSAGARRSAQPHPQGRSAARDRGASAGDGRSARAKSARSRPAMRIRATARRSSPPSKRGSKASCRTACRRPNGRACANRLRRCSIC